MVVSSYGVVNLAIIALSKHQGNPGDILIYIITMMSENKRYLLKDFAKLDQNTKNYLLTFQSQLKNRSIKEKDK